MAKTYSVGLVGESNYQNAIRHLKPGERVFLKPEPENQHDPRAIVVQEANGAPIGYVPRDHWLTEALIDQGKGSRALVQAIEGGDAGRPSLGVVLSVELGEKGAAAGGGAAPLPSAAEANRASKGKRLGIGCAVLLAGFVLLLVVTPKPTSDDKKEAAPAASDQVKMPGDEAMMSGSSSSSEAAESPAPEPSNDPGISAAEFARLYTGMSYSDAVDVIGSPGELSSETEMAGYRTQMYSWKAEGAFNIGGNANAMFQNGKLVSKAQFGLD